MDNLKMNRQLGTKWFTFYTKVRPCLACITVLPVIVDFIRYFDVYISNLWLLIYFTAALAQPILCIIIAIKSKGDYVDFVRFAKGVLLFESILIPYSYAIKQYIGSNFNIVFSLIVFAVALAISFLFWFRLNVKYFEKRILAPSNLETEYIADTNQTPYVGTFMDLNSQANQKHFCRRCGEKLFDDSQFCHKCGTEIIKE